MDTTTDRPNILEHPKPRQSREIVTFPDPVLEKPCRAFTDDEIKAGEADGINILELATEMAMLMRQSQNGIGLAAPQVGVSLKLIVVDAPGRKAAPLVLLNPEVIPTGEIESKSEGCLSLPGITVNVKRAKSIKVKARSLNGDALDFTAHETMARVLQHETDHCNGITILQRSNIIGNKKVNTALNELERVYKVWHNRHVTK